MPHVNEFFPLLGRVVHFSNVMLEWLITYAIHSTLLIGGLIIFTSTPFGRRLVIGSTTWLWRFALVGGLVTASLQLLRSASPVAGTLRLDGDTPTRTMVRVEVVRDREVVGTGSSMTTTQDTRRVVSTSMKVTPAWPLIVLGGWLLIAATRLSWFFIARRRFLRFIGPRFDGDHTLAGNSLRYLLREGHIQRPVRLTLSQRLTSPVALGDDEICLPERALAELDPIRMESILAHELAHLVRRDPAWLTISRVIEAIFFFQPLNILARRRMQESAEFASDAWASTRVARPLDLAHCLARVAEWTVAAPRLPVPAMAEGQGPGRRAAVLVRRVERLTTGRMIHEERPGRGLRVLAVMVLVGFVLMAPRVAIGADARIGQFFNTRVPGPAGILMLRGATSGALGEFKTVVVKVRGQ